MESKICNENDGYVDGNARNTVFIIPSLAHHGLDFSDKKLQFSKEIDSDGTGRGCRPDALRLIKMVQDGGGVSPQIPSARTPIRSNLKELLTEEENDMLFSKSWFRKHITHF
mmetsp:Transcript_33692/g.34319  ORF Transcript_33692/g.34319 Transcript_33692/m.34319 type:complete len:112 (+) Transcript_33692:259-594(+)